MMYIDSREKIIQEVFFHQRGKHRQASKNIFRISDRQVHLFEPIPWTAITMLSLSPLENECFESFLEESVEFSVRNTFFIYRSQPTHQNAYEKTKRARLAACASYCFYISNKM